MRKGQKEVVQKLQEMNVIDIKAVSWNKDSHGLFDYESKNYIHQKFKHAAGDLLIYRHKDNSTIAVFDAKTIKDEDLEDYTFLIRIYSQVQEGVLRYFVGKSEPSVEKGNQEQMMTEVSFSDDFGRDEAYIIVKNARNAQEEDLGHALEIGQTLKLGRIEFAVIEIRNSSQKEVSETSNFSFFKNESKLEVFGSQAEQGSLCKVCMEDLEEEHNFMVSPCLCAGSCKHIHIGCLKNWMLSKVKKEIVGGTAYYHFDKFECEICKHPLPKVVVKNSIQYELLTVERPEGSYLILEEVGKKKSDIMVIKNIPMQGIGLGRGHECSIRMNDISVSRQHAQIVRKNDKFVILDKGSKFGTLIKMTSSIPLDQCKRSLQIGRTVFTFSMKREKLVQGVKEESVTEAEMSTSRLRQRSK